MRWWWCPASAPGSWFFPLLLPLLLSGGGRFFLGVAAWFCPSSCIRLAGSVSCFRSAPAPGLPGSFRCRFFPGSYRLIFPGFVPWVWYYFSYYFWVFFRVFFGLFSGLFSGGFHSDFTRFFLGVCVALEKPLFLLSISHNCYYVRTAKNPSNMLLFRCLPVFRVYLRSVSFLLGVVSVVKNPANTNYFFLTQIICT